jgi:surface polysaccharide O-acyltransferase-like enzyme
MSSHTAKPKATASAERLYFLDWLRILAFAVLVLYHVGMYYVSWDFHVKSPFAGPDLVPWMKLSEPWRMSLLFMVSGAVTAKLLNNGLNLTFVLQRSARLLKPLLCGMLFIIPPQSYFEVIQKFHYAGSYVEFLRLYYTGYGSFCDKGSCLMLPTWNHLWFLPYLWVYTLLACTVIALRPSTWAQASQLAERAFRGWGLLLIPMAWIFFLRLTLFERYPSTHALWGDGFNHGIYLTMFVIGATLAASHTLWDRLAELRWPALWLAICFWAVLVFMGPTKPLAHAVIAVYQWSALVAAFGFAKIHLDRDSWLRTHLSEAVFPVYLFHQSIILVMSQVLLPFGLRPAIEGPILIICTFTLSYAGYELVRRIGFLRPWFGLKSSKHGR